MDNLMYLECRKERSIITLTLNRPKYNILNIQMIEEINCELKKIINDKFLKCLVFDSIGESWCAGVEVSDHKPDMVEKMILGFTKMFELIHRIQIPIIAKINGSCLGGGMELAISCDMIFALDKAVFAQPEVKLGFFPPYAAFRLPSIVGEARSIEILTSGKYYSAQEAFNMGMISDVFSSYDELDEGVELMLKEIKKSSPLIIRLNKRAIKEHAYDNFEDKLKKINELFLGTLMKTKDVLEGIDSFEKKRRAVWQNC